jgi:eukaryotic-like serine/threonine-protein kinase
MNPTRWNRIQDLFHQAAGLEESEQRAYLESACGGDSHLVSAVVAMLDEDRRDASLLENELPEVAHSLLSNSNVPQSFGPYRIQKVLGEGGMGVVYLAEREDVGLLVAVKLLRDALLSPARKARFTSESRTLARLDHPLIARIHDAGALADGTPWFAMEYVDGVPITEYCRARNASITERLRVFRSLCEAVQYAHAHAFIHRDLKPSNVLVKSDGSIKLLDFGIAKQLEIREEPANRTLTGLRPMTLAYASPEQIRGEPLGTQSDVYSLGVMLYELLTGRLPFDVSKLTQSEAEHVLLQQEAEAPSVAAQRNAPVSKRTWPDLDVLCLTAMHRDPQRRYRSVEAWMRDIDHYVRGEPLDARPDTLGYRLGKFARRNWRAISVTAAACAILIGLVAFFVVRLARARTAAFAEATRTQRIERFMLTLFEGGDKTAGPADDLKAITLLDRGVQNARALNGEPAVQAELYQTLGSIYEKLGKLDRADPLLQSSLHRHKAVSGPDSADVANDLVALGRLRLEQSQLPEAERLVRDGLAMAHRHLPPNDPAVAKALSTLGRVLEERGSYDESVKTLDEAVRLQSARGDVTPDLSDSVNELATAHYYLGQRAQADALYRRALAMDRQLYGDLHPRVADDYYGVGLLQHDLGRDAEAERYFRDALRVKKSWYGNDHPDTALITAAVGQSLMYQGRFDEAAQTLQDALAIQERLFGKNHAQVAMTLNQIGVLEIRRGHLDDAEKDLLRMADINRSVYGDRHYLVGIAYLNLGEVYLAQKDSAHAERSLREALSRFSEKLPADHPNTAIAHARLGHALVLEGQYKDAESQLLAGYNVLVKQPSGQEKRIQGARADLAAVYDALKEPEKAGKFRAQAASAPADPSPKPAQH